MAPHMVKYPSVQLRVLLHQIPVVDLVFAVVLLKPQEIFRRTPASPLATVIFGANLQAIHDGRLAH